MIFCVKHVSLILISSSLCSFVDMLSFPHVHLVVFLLCYCACVCVWKELLLKDEECERLSKVRDQLGQELEELTASLFQVGPPTLRLCPLLPVSFPPLPPEALDRKNMSD